MWQILLKLEPLDVGHIRIPQMIGHTDMPKTVLLRIRQQSLVGLPGIPRTHGNIRMDVKIVVNNIFHRIYLS